MPRQRIRQYVDIGISLKDINKLKKGYRVLKVITGKNFSLYFKDQSTKKIEAKILKYRKMIEKLAKKL